MNTKLRQKAKNNFEKDFFKFINNADLEKIWKREETYILKLLILNLEILNL